MWFSLNGGRGGGSSSYRQRHQTATPYLPLGGAVAAKCLCESCSGRRNRDDAPIHGVWLSSTWEELALFSMSDGMRWWLFVMMVALSLVACEDDEAEDGETEEGTETSRPPSVETGKALFEDPPSGQSCVFCHGLDGDIDSASNQTVDATDLTTWDGDAETVEDAIVKGRPAMPSYSGFSSDDLRDIALYVLSLRDN